MSELSHLSARVVVERVSGNALDFRHRLASRLAGNAALDFGHDIPTACRCAQLIGEADLTNVVILIRRKK